MHLHKEKLDCMSMMTGFCHNLEKYRKTRRFVCIKSSSFTGKLDFPTATDLKAEANSTKTHPP